MPATDSTVTHAAGRNFPQQRALTQRFTLGVPRNFAVTEDGRHVTFLRSRGPTDPVNCLWLFEVATGTEHLLADPLNLNLVGTDPVDKGTSDISPSDKGTSDTALDDAAIPAAELARRERVRESAGGIVSYSSDRTGLMLAFALQGVPFVLDARSATGIADNGAGDSATGGVAAGGIKVRRIELANPAANPDSKNPATEPAGVFDPRLSPDGRYLSFVVGDSLWLAPTDGSAPGQPALTPETELGNETQGAETVSWGSAEFIAAEEMRRTRGHWWSPHSDALAVARVDVTPVQQWHIADPANPDAAPHVVRYPAAGTANAIVELYVAKLTTLLGENQTVPEGTREAVLLQAQPLQAQPLQAQPVQVRWDAEKFPYMCQVNWDNTARPVSDGTASPINDDVASPDGTAPETELTLTVQSRDQREMRTLSANPATGETETIIVENDPAWVDIVPGVPARSPLGLLTISSDRALLLDGQQISPNGEWVRGIADVELLDEPTQTLRVLYLASHIGTNVSLCYVTVSGVTIGGVTADEVTVGSGDVVGSGDATQSDAAQGDAAQGDAEESGTGHIRTVDKGVVTSADGYVTAVAAKSGTCAVGEASLQTATTFTVRKGNGKKGDLMLEGTLESQSRQQITSFGADPFEALGYDAEHPCQIELSKAGELEIPTAVLWPRQYGTQSITQQGTQQANERLPILLDPYGGPGAQRVVQARAAYAEAQWFADQGFCVVIADGRGTPGRGTSGRGANARNHAKHDGKHNDSHDDWHDDWQRAIKGDLATHALADQVTALEHVIETYADRVNPSAVAIKGWSFGGYLAALAVLRRPDLFHAAVAGAPVTDWRLYDTHYTERYLGDPNREPDNYRRSSLVDDSATLTGPLTPTGESRDNPRAKRPIMLIHGIADDNVVVAHTLRLSSALLTAGHPHEVLPLTGVTHMTPQPEVAEHLLLAQLDFLRRRLIN